jgi:HlyD family secretion protein
MTTLRPGLHHPSTSRRRVVRWAKRGVLALLALGVLAAIVRAWLPQPVAVELGRAHRAELTVEVAQDGQTRVRDRFVVAAPIAGNLERIELEPGTAVACGDVIARIAAPDPALLDARSRDEANARLASAIARQRRAESAIARGVLARDAAIRDADRARALARQGAIPATEREGAELAEQLAMRDLAAAEAERAAASAEVAGARAVLGRGATAGAAITVTAPADGRVLRVVRDSAGPVAAGAPLVELGDSGALEIVVDVLSSDAARIAPGMDVVVEGWGGDAALHGQVRRVEPSAFTRVSALGVEEQRVNVIASIADPPAALGDGYRVDARIITWHGANVLVVPASAVFRDRDRWAVYVVERGRAHLVPVVLGHHGRIDVEITRGLADGVSIVLHPGDRVTENAHVVSR